MKNQLLAETMVIGKGSFSLALRWDKVDIAKKVICSVGPPFPSSLERGYRLLLAIFSLFLLLNPIWRLLRCHIWYIWEAERKPSEHSFVLVLKS